MMMSTQLRLVAVNPNPVRRQQVTAVGLHVLADHLTTQVRLGNADVAHVIAAHERLNPLGIAVVATWMSRAGLSEDQIIRVVA
jgi:hypothetical protein